MPDPEPVDEEGGGEEQLRLEQWLEERFRELGYIEPDALQLAAVHVDWHRVDALIRAGCPREVAARIVL